MGSTRELTNALWRKSSYSGGTGGDCIECAALDGATWHKSSYSGSTGGDCIEVATPTGTVAVRDSKDPGRGHFQVTPKAFGEFVTAAAHGRL
ncbi:DUF397 domain-containing protein [Streptomyces sp. NPDC058067]|uniref:DUF397 domain-containing protein n=1 Tax=Streptomyces sp. NPDC058067 TaxID=3346324 RepID=UPI0036EEEBEC